MPYQCITGNREHRCRKKFLTLPDFVLLLNMFVRLLKPSLRRGSCFVVLLAILLVRQYYNTNNCYIGFAALGLEEGAVRTIVQKLKAGTKQGGYKFENLEMGPAYVKSYKAIANNVHSVQLQGENVQLAFVRHPSADNKPGEGGNPCANDLEGFLGPWDPVCIPIKRSIFYEPIQRTPLSNQPFPSMTLPFLTSTCLVQPPDPVTFPVSPS